MIGASTAAHQVEGSNTNSDYWAMEHLKHTNFNSLPYESSTGYGKLQTNYEAGEDINYYRLPCMLVADTYPLSFHRETLFAGMLGKPTQHLTIASYPEKTSDTYTERTEYTYSFDKNKKPVSLKVSTKYGNGKSISYLNRTISITIE